MKRRHIPKFHERLDKIFASGKPWAHRTLRTVLDPYSTEWKRTELDEKISIVKSILDAGEDLGGLVMEYKAWYVEEKGQNAEEGKVEDALLELLKHLLSRSA